MTQTLSSTQEIDWAESIMPHNLWLRQQAQSFLGRPCSLEEAIALWSRIDINTRKPIPAAPTRLGLLARLVRALSAVGGMMKGQRSNS